MDTVTLGSAINLLKKYVAGVALNGGTLTDIARQPDGTLNITYTPTTGSPIVFNAGVIPAGANGETPVFQAVDNVLQFRFPSDPPGTWADLHTFTTPTYTHNQVTPAAVWNIQHNTGVLHLTAVFVDDTGKAFKGVVYDYENSTVNMLKVFVGEPIAGKAFIN